MGKEDGEKYLLPNAVFLSVLAFADSCSLLPLVLCCFCVTHLSYMASRFLFLVVFSSKFALFVSVLHY